MTESNFNIEERKKQLEDYFEKNGEDLGELLDRAPDIFKQDTSPEPSKAPVTDKEIDFIFGSEEADDDFHEMVLKNTVEKMNEDPKNMGS